MSLLLEALKKAEKAKQEQVGKPVSPPEQGPGAPRTVVPEAGRTDSWEAEAPAPMRAGRPGTHLSLDDLPPPSALKPSVAEGAVTAEERSGAEALFAAKRLNGSRKNFIFGLLALLFLGLAGGGAYVWWEISQPTAPQVAARTPTAPAPAPTPIAKAPPAAPAAAAAPQAEPAKPTEAAPAKAAEPGAAEKTPVEPPARGTPARRAAAAPEATSPIRITRTPADAAVNAVLAGAYQAFAAGDLARAEQGYLRFLDIEPRNRDALLGLAVIALKRDQPQEAERHYLRLLELDPRDPAANAGIMATRAQSDPRQVESRLKILIGQQPDSAVLQFALGNIYARESRWAEAQQAYFRAMRAEPGNADYAFNLAVSLDHLSQNKVAADYYRRALALASRGPASFDRQLATGRVRDLEQ